MAHTSFQTDAPVSPGAQSPAIPATSVVRSDVGTIVLHWLTAISMVVSLVTGFRISADALDAKWAQSLTTILPQGELWTWHIAAGLTLAGIISAYWVYLKRAALADRNGSSRLRTLTPPTNKRLQLRAINVALHWLAYAAILLLTATGIALFLGYASWFLTIHNVLAWTMLFYIAIHTITHFLYGGVAQILRLFRPAPLQDTPKTRIWPLGIALFVGTTGAATLALIDWGTRPTINPMVISESPTLDGKLEETFWQNAQSVFVETHQGANLDGAGTSTVEIKTAINGDKIHFAFRWQDPTRSLMRAPVVKTTDGWRVIANGSAEADVNDYYEDKFAVLFSYNDGMGGGESTFLGEDPLPDYPKSPHGRGLHYTADGRVMDLWQWKSSRGGMLGHVDDMHFGPPKKPDVKQAAGKKRYAAGYDADPGKAIYEYNYIVDGPDGYDSPVKLKRLPVDLVQLRLDLGTIPATADGNNDAGSAWWMTRENSVPYSASLDAAIPLGTILPTTLNIHTYEGDRADLSGGAKWQDGIWTLEVTRKLDTGSPYDVAFHPGQRIHLWVSVFDHNQTRHTRHQRAVVLDIPSDR